MVVKLDKENSDVDEVIRDVQSLALFFKTELVLKRIGDSRGLAAREEKTCHRKLRIKSRNEYGGSKNVRVLV